jgi:hypothetical protein
MAVVALITSIEERFGFVVEDDEIDGSTFATVSSLPTLFSRNSQLEQFAGASHRAFHAVGRRRPRFCILQNAVPDVPFRWWHSLCTAIRGGNEQVAARDGGRRRAIRPERLDCSADRPEGCGDSSGDLASARWQDWKEVLLAADLSPAARSIRILWGLRSGALLAAAVVDRIAPQPDLLLWQPVSSRKLHLTQFLRLKCEAMLDGSGQQSHFELRKELASGRGSGDRGLR